MLHYATIVQLVLRNEIIAQLRIAQWRNEIARQLAIQIT